MMDKDIFLDIEIRGTENLHQYDELAKIFLQPSQYLVHGDGQPTVKKAVKSPVDADKIVKLIYDVSADESADKFEDRYRTARKMYENLASYTGKRPKWGVLTGIRPVKLAGEIYEHELSNLDVDSVSDIGIRSLIGDILRKRYLLDDEKNDLVTEIFGYQQETAGRSGDKEFSLYVGIPFCPTRCLYCSFTSTQADEKAMKMYVEALSKEIAFASEETRKKGLKPESIYVGGGTPTSLSEDLLNRVLTEIRDGFDLSGLREITVEAGRPDTITEGRLEVLKKNGVDKISINPQSMKQATLDLIGRKHRVEDTEKAFELARRAGMGSINMDLIAGLPEEEPDDFIDSLERVVEMGPEKVTLHTLAVKRASRLKEKDENFSYKDEEIREAMLAFAHKKLRMEGYRPYYLYRQKYTSGNTENTGWCRKDDVGIYNIRIMDEHQSILALGAGGISKRYFPEENRLERIPNVSNYEIYIDRVDDMLNRKKRTFFEGGK